MNRALEILAPLQAYQAEDLRVWRRSLIQTHTAFWPSRTPSPNPVLHGDLAIVNTFSPGRSFAVRRQTGEIV